MAIKNPDGTKVNFSSPNPLMKNQEGWSRKEKFICYNCSWGICGLFRQYGSYTQAQDRTICSISAIPTLPEPSESTITDDDTDFSFLRENAIQIHCLPARYREDKDALYGQRYRTIRYGSKFIFEGIVTEQEDFYIEFWTTVKEVTAGSSNLPHEQRQAMVEGRKHNP